MAFAAVSAVPIGCHQFIKTQILELIFGQQIWLFKHIFDIDEFVILLQIPAYRLTLILRDHQKPVS